MTRARFISMVRQYAVQAKRRSRSYALQVEALLLLRMTAVENSGISPYGVDAEYRWSHKFVNREYAPHDETYQRHLEM